MNKQEFIYYCKNDLNIEITQNHLQKLDKYYELLIEYNNKFNLTTIIQKEQVYLKHFYDSLCLSKTQLLKQNKTICDFGTGPGFPGIIIALFYNNLNITLIESNKKKCNFLQIITKELNLKNINIINNRAELFSKENKEQFDLITCRAVSHLKIISEIAIPMLKINGYFIPLKANITQELIESKQILNLLNTKLQKVINYNLPIELSIRNIPIINKISQTNNKYPRQYNKMK